jgi:hypothetical protein
MLSLETVFFGLVSLLALALIAFSFLFWRLRKLGRELLSVRGRVQEQPMARQASEKNFSQDLLLADIKQDLNQRKMQVHGTDRYRYVASLVNNGLTAHQIADILGLGRGEAEQLAGLALIPDRRAKHANHAQGAAAQHPAAPLNLMAGQAA